MKQWRDHLQGNVYEVKGNVGLEAKQEREWFRKTSRGTECKPEPAVGQGAGREPARSVLGPPGPEGARLEQTRREEAIKHPGLKLERKQNETRFG